MLSDYCSNIKNLHGISSGNVKKLAPTLPDKNIMSYITKAYNSILVLV